MANTKITKALTWQALESAYRIRTKNGVKENELAEAIATGEILALLQACANELHDGDFASTIKSFRRNLSSMKCNKVKADNFRTVDRERYELLNAYTEQFVVTTTSAVIPGKAKVNYGKDDIMSLRGNHEELRKLYNIFADRKSKRPESIDNEFNENFALIKQLKAEAKKEEATKVDPSILEKLQAGKKLTAAEAKALVELLTK